MKAFWKRFRSMRAYGASLYRALFVAFGNSPDDWQDYVRMIFGLYIFGGLTLIAFFLYVVITAKTVLDLIAAGVLLGCLIHYWRQRP